MSSRSDAVGAQVRVFVQTRGAARATDYAFLGGAPAQAWWRAYRDATAFDHPTVLVTSDGDRWAAYLSGIPSARIDAVGTVVRYTLVLDGPCGAADATCVTAGVAAWLDDVADGGGPGRLSAALDARFPSDDVQRWLATDERHSRPTGSDERHSRPESGGAVTGEVRRRALAALAALPVPPALPVPHGANAAFGASDAPDAAFAPSTATDVAGDWIGAVGSLAGRSAFVARVAALVGGVRGRALLLNLVGGPDDVAALRDPASPLAVLVETADRTLARPAALPPVVEAKKASAPPARVAAATGTAAVLLTAPVLLTTLVLVALVVTVLVLVLVF